MLGLRRKRPGSSLVQDIELGRLWIQMHHEGGARAGKKKTWVVAGEAGKGMRKRLTVREKRRGVVVQAGDAQWWTTGLGS